MEEHATDGPEGRSLPERCILWTTAGPPMLPGPYNNNFQIVQTRDRVVILNEMIHNARIIPLDGGRIWPATSGSGREIRADIGTAKLWSWIPLIFPMSILFAGPTGICI